jgi:fermentation-respiration switch protein FrsA (DUF1100 family)
MRIIVNLLIFAAGAWFLLALMLYLFQHKMVFLANMPGRALTASPEDIGLPYENVILTTRDGERIHGWYVSAPVSRGVVLFFHGNAGNISHRLDSILVFARLGMDTLIVDYRGYGESSGKTSEKGTYLDAQAAWDHLIDERRIPADRVIIFGRSLGGAVGAWLGTRNRPAAVIIESSFSSGVDIAKRLYPFLPARLITRLNYPVSEYAARLECPVLVAHSRDDEIIPFEMGEAIYEAVTTRKAFLEMRGDHNSGFFVSGQDYTNGLDKFISSVLDPARQPDRGL